MDPLSIAGAFATIVGLICNFKSERKSDENISIDDFLVWLSTQNGEIKSLIESNQLISLSIQKILKEDNAIFADKLNKIDDILAGIASKVDLFTELALAVKPNVEISDQAISILSQLINSGAPGFIFSYGEIVVLGEGYITFDEPRFLEDDLTTLSEYGLLRLDNTSQGDRRFTITRNAIRFHNAINTNSSN